MNLRGGRGERRRKGRKKTLSCDSEVPVPKGEFKTPESFHGFMSHESSIEPFTDPSLLPLAFSLTEETRRHVTVDQLQLSLSCEPMKESAQNEQITHLHLE